MEPHIMKQIKVLYTLALIIFSTINLNAQWTNIYTDTEIGLIGIDCINEDTVYAAAYNSKVLRTFDKGQTWETIDPGFEIYAKDIDFPTAKTGYIVGAVGRIAKTVDYGDTWELIITDTIYRLEKAEFLHPDTGWIIANGLASGYWGVILRTYNGGANWNYHFSEDYELFDIEMLNNSKGFIGINSWSAGDEYGFLKTIDGGDTWNLSNPEMDFVTSISFIDDEIGYCLGMYGPEGGSFKTIDGGENWDFSQGGAGGYSVNRLQFINEQTGYYSGWEVMFDDGLILRTDDGGYTWNEQITGTFFDFEMINIDTGYAVTDYSRIYKTVNGGIPVGIDEINSNCTKNINIIPNPFHQKSTLYIHPDILQNSGHLSFALYNLDGIKVKHIFNIKTNETEISRSNLPPGIYFYSLSSENKIIKSGKLLIQ